MTTKNTPERQAQIVRERLSYHFANTSGGWNIPPDMPFMQEFLNEVRTLCDLCQDQTPADTVLSSNTKDN